MVKPLKSERGRQSSARRLAVDGMLCAAAIVGRIALSALPNVQPVTAIIILMAVYIGTWDAAVSAVVIVLITNLILGMGIWSLYQIAAWVLIALLSAALLKKWHPPAALLIWAIVCGFGYGAFVSIFSWRMINTGAAAASYTAYWLAGLLADAYHAVGNGVFIWFLIPVFEKILKLKEQQ